MPTLELKRPKILDLDLEMTALDIAPDVQAATTGTCGTGSTYCSGSGCTDPSFCTQSGNCTDSMFCNTDACYTAACTGAC